MTDEPAQDDKQPEQKAPYNSAEIAKLQESVAALEKKNKELLDEKQAAKAKAEAAAMESAKGKGDIEAIEKSWQDKLKATQDEFQGKLEQYETMVSQMTAGQQALKLASELALPGSADVLLPHINNRLRTEIQDGKPIVRVLDADGKPSAMSVEDLKKEISENKAFAPLLLGSQASGGGGVNGSGKGGAKTMTRAAFDTMDAGSKAQFMKDGGKLTD